MKFLKIAGIITAVIAFFCGLGIVGRVEMEDRQYQSGEISQEELTTDEELITQILICGGVAVAGGLMWSVGTYIEAGRIERKYKRYYIR